MSPAATGARPRLLLPEPDRLWIRYAPRAREWREVAPPGALRWLDLAEGDLAGGGAGSEADSTSLPLPAGPFDDVLYLPPVAPAHAAARDEMARSHAAEGTPVVVQVLAGEEIERVRVEGIVVVRDLLEALLAGGVVEHSRFEPDLEPGPGDVALWPLIPGLTDGAELVDEGLRRLAAAGFRTVQGVAPDLPAAQRRELYEGAQPEGSTPQGEDAGAEEDDDRFQALFHGPGADPRAFARAAHRHGLSPFLPRPLPRPPLSGAPEREAAGLLALAGELSFRLGQPGRGQAHLRAARFLDRTTYDLRALAREGNLPVLHWLGEESRAIVEEWTTRGESRVVAELVSAYVAPV